MRGFAFSSFAVVVMLLGCGQPQSTPAPKPEPSRTPPPEALITIDDLIARGLAFTPVPEDYIWYRQNDGTEIGYMYDSSGDQQGISVHSTIAFCETMGEANAACRPGPGSYAKSDALGAGCR